MNAELSGALPGSMHFFPSGRNIFFWKIFGSHIAWLFLQAFTFSPVLLHTLYLFKIFNRNPFLALISGCIVNLLEAVSVNSD